MTAERIVMTRIGTHRAYTRIPIYHVLDLRRR